MSAFLAFGAVSGAGMKLHSEADVKAAFIYNFTKFVQWPSCPEACPILLIGYCGGTKMMEALKRLEGRKCQQMLIKVKKITDFHDLAELKVMVIENSSDISEEMLRGVSERNILTISQGPDAVEKGVVIGLFKENNRIRFAINLRKAKENGLKISSRLLKLAKYVIR